MLCVVHDLGGQVDGHFLLREVLVRVQVDGAVDVSRFGRADHGVAARAQLVAGVREAF
ncbi:MAG: hypothetical protein ACLSVD_17960 [Eggerthellaceae bacterium]